MDDTQTVNVESHIGNFIIFLAGFLIVYHFSSISLGFNLNSLFFIVGCTLMATRVYYKERPHQKWFQ